MKLLFNNIKDLLKQYDLLPKVLSILLAVILWANLQNNLIDEISYKLYPEIHNLSQNLIILQDIPKIMVTIRGRKDYIKTVSPSNIKLYIDLSKPVVGKVHNYKIQIKTNELLNNLDYTLERDFIGLTIYRIKTKTVNVEPNIIGELSPQYKKGIVNIEPPTVKITGPEPVVDQIKMLTIYPLNIANEHQTLYIDAHIHVSQYTKITVHPDTVKVIIPILPVSNLIALTVPLEIQNKKTNVIYNVKHNTVTIYVKKAPLVQDINENYFVAYINGDIEYVKRAGNIVPVIVEKKVKLPVELFAYEPLKTEVIIDKIE